MPSPSAGTSWGYSGGLKRREGGLDLGVRGVKVGAGVRWAIIRGSGPCRAPASSRLSLQPLPFKILQFYESLRHNYNLSLSHTAQITPFVRGPSPQASPRPSSRVRPLTSLCFVSLRCFFCPLGMLTLSFIALLTGGATQLVRAKAGCASKRGRG